MCVCVWGRERGSEEGRGHYARCLAVEHVIGLALHWLYKQTICQMQIQITLLECLPLSTCLPFCHGVGVPPAPLLFGCPCRVLACCCVANWKTIRNQSQPAKAGRGKQARPQSDRWRWSWSCRWGGAGSGSWRSINNSCGMFYGRSSKPFRIAHTPHTRHTHSHPSLCMQTWLSNVDRVPAKLSIYWHVHAHVWPHMVPHSNPSSSPPLLLTPQGRALSMARVIARQIDGQSSISLVVWPLAIITGSPQCPRSPPAFDWSRRARSICQRFASSTYAMGATLCALN